MAVNRIFVAISMAILALALSYALTMEVIGVRLPIEIKPIAKTYIETAFNPFNPLMSAMTPEVVTAIVWDYRGIDTFFEVSVFYIAIIGVVALFYTKAIRNWKSSRAVGLSLIAKTVTKIVSVFIAVVGIAIVLHGHLTPGGGFQGGSAIAIASALILVTFGLAKLVTRGASYSTMLTVRNLSLIGLTLVALTIPLASITTGLNGYVFQNQPKPGAPLGLPAQLNGIVLSGSVLWLNILDGLAVAAGFTLLLIFFSIPEEAIERS